MNKKKMATERRKRIKNTSKEKILRISLRVC